MKIVADDKIPYVRECLESMADEVVYLPGKSISRESVADADALMVRTRTIVDRALLEGTSVRFVATATIGFDHIDTGYCKRAGVAWSNCPGCNAGSVEQYLQSSLIILERHLGKRLEDMTLGVVGVGHVGSRVARMAGEMGMKVLLNDPPRAESEHGGDKFCPLETIMEQADIITFHTPLSRTGKYPTYHLAGEDFFEGLRRCPVIINTSRGEVVDTTALKRAMSCGKVRTAVIDVWEDEPDIDRELLASVLIGTPHIAGYSADGKANASRMSVENICRFFGLKAACRIEPPVPPCTVIRADGMKDALLQIYDPREDCKRLRAEPEQFERLRGSYPLRREKEAYTFVLGQ